MQVLGENPWPWVLFGVTMVLYVTTIIYFYLRIRAIEVYFEYLLPLVGNVNFKRIPHGRHHISDHSGHDIIDMYNLNISNNNNNNNDETEIRYTDSTDSLPSHRNDHKYHKKRRMQHNSSLHNNNKNNKDKKKQKYERSHHHNHNHHNNHRHHEHRSQMSHNNPNGQYENNNNNNNNNYNDILEIEMKQMGNIHNNQNNQNVHDINHINQHHNSGKNIHNTVIDSNKTNHTNNPTISNISNISNNKLNSLNNDGSGSSGTGTGNGNGNGTPSGNSGFTQSQSQSRVNEMVSNIARNRAGQRSPITTIVEKSNKRIYAIQLPSPNNMIKYQNTVQSSSNTPPTNNSHNSHTSHGSSWNNYTNNNNIPNNIQHAFGVMSSSMSASMQSIPSHLIHLGHNIPFPIAPKMTPINSGQALEVSSSNEIDEMALNSSMAALGFNINSIGSSISPISNIHNVNNIPVSNIINTVNNNTNNNKNNNNSNNINSIVSPPTDIEKNAIVRTPSSTTKTLEYGTGSETNVHNDNSHNNNNSINNNNNKNNEKSLNSSHNSHISNQSHHSHLISQDLNKSGRVSRVSSITNESTTIRLTPDVSASKTMIFINRGGRDPNGLLRQSAMKRHLSSNDDTSQMLNESINLTNNTNTHSNITKLSRPDDTKTTVSKLSKLSKSQDNSESKTECKENNLNNLNTAKNGNVTKINKITNANTTKPDRLNETNNNRNNNGNDNENNDDLPSKEMLLKNGSSVDVEKHTSVSPSSSLTDMATRTTLTKRTQMTHMTGIKESNTVNDVIITNINMSDFGDNVNNSNEATNSGHYKSLTPFWINPEYVSSSGNINRKKWSDDTTKSNVNSFDLIAQIGSHTANTNTFESTKSSLHLNNNNNNNNNNNHYYNITNIPMRLRGISSSKNSKNSHSDSIASSMVVNIASNSQYKRKFARSEGGFANVISLGTNAINAKAILVPVPHGSDMIDINESYDLDDLKQIDLHSDDIIHVPLNLNISSNETKENTEYGNDNDNVISNAGDISMTGTSDRTNRTGRTRIIGGTTVVEEMESEKSKNSSEYTNISYDTGTNFV